MTPVAAIETIRECVAASRVIVKGHCMERLAQRGLFWGDLLCLLESPKGIRGDGEDDLGRERWFV